MVRVTPPTGQVTCAYEFSTHKLAYMLDSLVRVSRRVHDKASVKFVGTQIKRPGRPDTSNTKTAESTNKGEAYTVSAIQLDQSSAHSAGLADGVSPRTPYLAMPSPSTISSTF